MTRLKNNTGIYLFLILGLATVMRLFFLDSIPLGFNCDEAANGYESYSILQTLRDRYGKPMPLFFNILKNDAREPFYIYLTVPFIKILGLNEFSTRLPAAIIGVLTVWVVYLLVKEIYNQKVALTAALLLAVSPWLVHFNRVAFRLNLLPLLFCLGILFFVKSLKQPKYLPLSSLIFAFTLHTYSPARVVVSLFLLAITIIFYKHLWKNKQITLISLAIFLVIFIPLFRFWLSPQAMVRARGTGMESDLLVILQNYLSHFSPNLLFFQGSPRITENPAGIGELYFFELITFPLGLVKLWREKGKIKLILLLWLFLYPFPAFLIGLGNPQRSIIGVPIFAIISAIGINYLMELFQGKRKIVTFITGVILTGCVTFFSHQYFVKYPSEAATLWNYGMKEAITFAEKSDYSGYVMSSDTNSGCYAIHDFVAFVPFYTLYPPETYQSSPVSPWVRGSQDKIYSIGNYYLMSISRQDSLDEDYLYILRPEEIATLETKGYNWTEIHTIKDFHGVEHYKLVKISGQ